MRLYHAHSKGKIEYGRKRKEKVREKRTNGGEREGKTEKERVKGHRIRNSNRNGMG